MVAKALQETVHLLAQLSLHYHLHLVVVAQQTDETLTDLHQQAAEQNYWEQDLVYRLRVLRQKIHPKWKLLSKEQLQLTEIIRREYYIFHLAIFK